LKPYIIRNETLTNGALLNY